MSEETDGKKVIFEESLAQLEKVVRKLEDGNVPLDESLNLYSEGVMLLKECNQQLENVRRKVEMLISVDSAGRPETVPLSDVQRKITDE